MGMKGTVLVIDSGITVTQDHVGADNHAVTTPICRRWRKPSEPAVEPIAPAIRRVRLELPLRPKLLGQPHSHPAARYSSVIPLHGLLPDLPCAAISPTGSVLVAIISSVNERVRLGSCGRGSDLFTGNVKVMRQ